MQCRQASFSAEAVGGGASSLPAPAPYGSGSAPSPAPAANGGSSSGRRGRWHRPDHPLLPPFLLTAREERSAVGPTPQQFSGRPSIPQDLKETGAHEKIP
jgi:hypothetical protein